MIRILQVWHIVTVLFFKIYFIYWEGTVTEGEKESERDLLVHSPTGHSEQAEIRSREFTLGLPQGYRGRKNLGYVGCFPRQAHQMGGGREVKFPGLNGYPYGMNSFTHCAHSQPYTCFYHHYKATHSWACRSKWNIDEFKIRASQNLKHEGSLTKPILSFWFFVVFPLRVLFWGNFSLLNGFACLGLSTLTENMSMTHLKAIPSNSVLTHKSEDNKDFPQAHIRFVSIEHFVGIITLIIYSIWPSSVFKLQFLWGFCRDWRQVSQWWMWPGS